MVEKQVKCKNKELFAKSHAPNCNICTMSNRDEHMHHNNTIVKVVETNSLEATPTTKQFEGAEDLALGSDPLDVGVVLQREQAVVRVLPDLHHFKVTGVVTGRVLAVDNAPVHCLGIPQSAAYEVTAGFGREVAIKCDNVLCREKRELKHIGIFLLDILSAHKVKRKSEHSLIHRTFKATGDLHDRTSFISKSTKPMEIMNNTLKQAWKFEKWKKGFPQGAKKVEIKCQLILQTSLYCTHKHCIKTCNRRENSAAGK